MAVFGRWLRGLRGRLLLLISIPLLALAVVGTVALRGISTESEDIRVFSGERLPLTKHDGTLRVAYNAVSRFVLRALLEDSNPADRAKTLDEVAGRIKDFETAYDAIQKLPLSESNKQILGTIPAQWKEFKDIVEAAAVLLQKNNGDADEDARELLMGRLLKPAEELKATLNLSEEQGDRVNATITEASVRNATEVRFVSVVAMVIGMLIAFVVGIITASRLAGGLNYIATNIAEGGTQVSSASEQMSAASQQLSSASTESASALQETVASVEELSSMVKINADNAKEAASLSQESRTAAEEGETEIRKLNTAMGEVAQSSKKIEEIINVIDDIAFQTNLLALNAAVEAARAGDQGKGFAVVAEAVRALAQRSAAAAKDITGLIKDSVVKVEAGTKVADGSARALKSIVTSVKKVSDLNNEIAAASQEQSNGLAQISKAMNELDEATQRNASSAEETASASEELSSQAITLQDLVTQLTTIIEGESAHHSPAHSPVHSGMSTASVAPRRTSTVHAHEHAGPRGKAKGAKVIPMGGKKRSADAERVLPLGEEAEAFAKLGTTDGF